MKTLVFESVSKTLGHKIYGQHSLTVGSIIGLIVGGLIIWRSVIGKWSLILGLAIIAITLALF